MEERQDGQIPATIEELSVSVDRRFEAVDWRFEAVDRRFDAVEEGRRSKSVHGYQARSVSRIAGCGFRWQSTRH
jgi:hypothetical protein